MILLYFTILFKKNQKKIILFKKSLDKTFLLWYYCIRKGGRR
nr:MAG TPA: hypothetical protein [Caudoviricetes sp.]